MYFSTKWVLIRSAHRDTSNKYHSICFRGEITKKISIVFDRKKNVLSVALSILVNSLSFINGGGAMEVYLVCWDWTAYWRRKWTLSLYWLQNLSLSLALSLSHSLRVLIFISVFCVLDHWYSLTWINFQLTVRSWYFRFIHVEMYIKCQGRVF